MFEEFCTPEGYMRFVTKLVSSHSMTSFEAKLGTMGLGLAGEAGEIARLVNLCTYQGKVWNEEDNFRLVDELSDVCWYVCFTAGHVVGVPFCDLITHVPINRANDPAKAFRDSYVCLMATCGGVADQAKKLLFHGKPYNESVRRDLIDRLKSIMVSVALLAGDVCGVRVDDVIRHNVIKLSDRYKSLTFSTEEFLAKEKKWEE
jgi:hypothetical protein